MLVTFSVVDSSSVFGMVADPPPLILGVGKPGGGGGVGDLKISDQNNWGGLE